MMTQKCWVIKSTAAIFSLILIYACNSGSLNLGNNCLGKVLCSLMVYRKYKKYIKNLFTKYRSTVQSLKYLRG